MLWFRCLNLIHLLHSIKTRSRTRALFILISIFINYYLLNWLVYHLTIMMCIFIVKFLKSSWISNIILIIGVWYFICINEFTLKGSNLLVKILLIVKSLLIYLFFFLIVYLNLVIICIYRLLDFINFMIKIVNLFWKNIVIDFIICNINSIITCCARCTALCTFFSVVIGFYVLWFPLNVKF